MKRINPGRAGLFGILAAAALIGGGAVAVSQRCDASDEPTVLNETFTTAPTLSAELDALGLNRLEPERIVARETFGRMRVVPAGGPLEWDSAFEPQANLQAGELPARNDQLPGLAAADGSQFSLVLPTGFKNESAGSLSKVVGDQTQFVSGAIVLSKKGEQRPIVLEYWRLKAGSVVEVTAISGSSVWDLATLAGVTGFLQTPTPRIDFEALITVDFVVGDIYFRLLAPGTSPREAIQIVTAVREGVS